MKFISPAKENNQIITLSPPANYPGSASLLTMIKDEVTGKLYLVKENSNESFYPEHKTNAAIFEKASSALYRYFSSNTNVAEVEIIRLENGNLAIASEFIENFISFFPSELSITGDRIFTITGDVEINLDPESIFTTYLTARLIDDYDSFGSGFNSGLTTTNGEVKLAKIDTDGLKFAHFNEDTRKYYTSLGLISLISKEINRAYIDGDSPRYLTSYPIFSIRFNEMEGRLNEEFQVAEAIIKKYYPNSNLKDLLLGSIEYSSIKSSPFLFEQFTRAILKITSISEEELQSIIEQNVPNEFENSSLIKKILFKTLIIKREQLKHLYLLEYEFAKLGLEKGEEMSFEERLTKANERVDYSAQLEKINSAIINLNSEGQEEIFRLLHQEYSIDYDMMMSHSRFIHKSVQNALSQTINNLVKDKIENFSPGIPSEILSIIVENLEWIDLVLKKNGEESDSEEEITNDQLISMSRVYLEDNYIYISDKLKISVEKASQILQWYHDIVNNLWEMQIMRFMSYDQFSILLELASGNDSLENTDLFYSIISNHSSLRNYLNEKIMVYYNNNGRAYFVTMNEEDDNSYLILHTVIKNMIDNSQIKEMRETSVLLQTIKNNNINIAKILISFGACLLPDEVIPEEFSYLNDLIEQQRYQEAIANNQLAEVIIESIEDISKEEDYEFINAIIESVIDFVSNLKILPLTVSVSTASNVNYYPPFPNYDDDSSDDSGGGGSSGYFENPFSIEAEYQAIPLLINQANNSVSNSNDYI